MYLTKTLTREHLTRCRLCFGLVLCGISTFVSAQQWKFEPVVLVGAEYNDNIRLIRDDRLAIDGTALIIDANARFVRRAETSEVRIAPRVRSWNYTDNSVEDFNDFLFDFFAMKQTQRGEFGFQTRLAREDILNAEIDDPDFDNPDVNDPVNLDTGRIQVAGERDRVIVTPYFNYDLTEALGFGIRANYIDVDYDENQFNLIDYTSAYLGTELEFRVSERSAWSLGAFGTNYDADANVALNESQTVGADIGFRRQFSQTLEGWIRVGYQNIESDVTIVGVVVPESDNVTLFSAGLTQQNEISRVVLEASQDVDPNGSGFLQKRSQLRFRYERQLSPKMFGRIQARVQNSEELSELTNRLERDFQRYRIGLEWRLSRKWSIQADYEYTYQDYNDEVGDASSNAVAIGVVYNPARIR